MFICFMSNAQKNISLSIKNEIISNKIYTTISVKNNNQFDIVILGNALWENLNGGYYLREPISYLQFIAKSNTTEEIKTGKIVLSKLTKKIGDDKPFPYVYIQTGQVYTEKYLLFGETFIPYKAFDLSNLSEIHELKAKVFLRYIYLKDKATYETEVLSNTLTF